MPEVYGAAAGEWRPVHPREADELLAGVSARWWIAGGWAIDLFLGRQSRDHKDLDVGILRADAVAVLGALAGWEFFEAKGGVLFRLAAGVAPRVDVYSLWGRPVGTDSWVLELMLGDAVGDRLVYRRCPSVGLPFAEAIRCGVEGIAYLAPEFQLLYKARAVRGEDQADFERVVPRLGPEAVGWLRGALEVAEPGHPWLGVLRGLTAA